MNKLIYGYGSCGIESNLEIEGLMIKYQGQIKLQSLIPVKYGIIAKRDYIYIHANKYSVMLDELFNYEGSIKIIYAHIITKDLERHICKIIHHMDIISSIKTNYSDLTERTFRDMDYVYKYGNKVFNKTKIIRSIIGE
tara:strand:+ start:1197 stop:1610 length:414 start_codon:yes stop_codon:yes gene_type:complete